MTRPSDPIDQFVEEYRIALQDAARATADERRLDEERKITRSRLVQECGLPVAKAEHYAQAHHDYVAAAQALAVARDRAFSLEARVTYLAARIDIWRTRSANRRGKGEFYAG